MSTATPTAPVSGLSVQAVAKATGLDRTAIYRAAQEAQLGSPAHFRYAATEIVYTAQGLHQLAEGLERLGHDVAAHMLRNLLGRARQEAAVQERVTSPSAPALESWLSRFERQQEEAAA